MADKATAKPSAPASGAVLDDLAAFISTKMEITGMEPFVAKLLIDRWDALTAEQRMKRVLEMPQMCYICGAGGDSEDGHVLVHFAPDPRVGYTKLYCSQCCLQSLQGSDDDDDSEGWNDDEGCHDEFSDGGASQPQPSSSAPPTLPHTFASALVLIDSPSSPLMIQSISRVFRRLCIPPPVCA